MANQMTMFFRRFCGLVILFVVVRPVCAQQAAPVHLSERAQQILSRLNSFNSIDLGEWRYHLGDIPNGEDPNLDDSSWQSIGPKTGLPTEAIWFRHEISVPKQLNGYDVTNARVEFHIAVGAGGPSPLIIYMDGRQVALGADLAPIVLWEKAKPGDHVLIAVKALATDVAKNFRGASVTITTDAARPSPGDFYKEAVSDSWILSTVADGPALARSLEEAVTSVDTNALDRNDRQAFDASLRTAQQKLESLRSVVQFADIHMVGNSHMDAAWMWPWTETVETVRQTLGTSLQLMDEYPGYTFTQSTAQYFEWMQDKYPVLFERIKKRVNEDRFELVGGMWVEPDLNIPSGESQVRQILLAKRYFQKNFGVDIRVGWNPDSFGYNWQLPQIYKKSGIDYFVTQKMEWNDTNQLPLKLFWWQAPDGSKVLTYFPHGYGNGTAPIEMAKDYAQAVKLNPGIHQMMHLYGVGDHGGGPTRTVLNQAVHWQEADKVYPHIEFGTSLSFFQDVQRHVDTSGTPVWSYRTMGAGVTALPTPAAGNISLPIWDDELYLEFHRGAYTTQAAQKRNIRESEVRMLDAEKYSSLAWLGGKTYPQSDLNAAWKKVLFNEFHDLAAGTGIADIYKDAKEDFQTVRYTANQATSQALSALTSYVDTQTVEGTVPVLVFNSMAWKRTDVVEVHAQLPRASEGIVFHDAEGRELPSQIVGRSPETHTFDVLVRADDVPSLGYERLTAGPSTLSVSHRANSALRSSETTLENEYLRVVVDPKTGCITSLFDKRLKFESIAAGGCGNQLQAFHDLPKSWDAWNIDADYEQQPYDLGPARSVRLVESGPLRAVIRVTHSTQASRFVQDITLYAGIDRVDVSNDFDWHERHILLKAAFPLAASNANATYDIPYGTIQRPTTRNNSYEKARFEVPALLWADLGDGEHGFSLLNDSKYGYDAKANILRLTLLRSVASPDPDADQGQQHFVYALYPHSGDWKRAQTEQHAWDFNYSLKALQVEQHGGSLPAQHSFFAMEPSNVILTAVKKAEDGDALILRFYEYAGEDTKVRLRIPRGASSAGSTNLMEVPDKTPVLLQDGTVVMDVKPYSINTVKVNFQGPGPEYWGRP